MATLGDYLPHKEKGQYIEAHLKPGQILYLFCDFTTPPKEKYLVLACPGENPLLFIINSEIHPFIASRPELKNVKSSYVHPIIIWIMIPILTVVGLLMIFLKRK